VTPTAEHLFLAKCPAALLISPRALDFGVVTAATEAVRQVEIRPGIGQPAVDLDEIQVTALDAHLRVSRSATLDGRLLLRVVLPSTVPPGSLQSSVVLRFKAADEEREMQVPVTAEVLAPVMVAPSTVHLSQKSGAVAREMTFTVWRTDRKSLGRVADLKKPEGLSVQERPISVSERRLFAVKRGGRQLEAGRHTIEVAFESGSDDEPGENKVVRVEVLVDDE
jgi:hypothetical protein